MRGISVIITVSAIVLVSVALVGLQDQGPGPLTGFVEQSLVQENSRSAPASQARPVPGPSDSPRLPMISPASVPVLDSRSPSRFDLPRGIMRDPSNLRLPPLPAGKPVCPDDGCLWGGKGIHVKMYDGVITTPKDNFLFSECDVPKDGCHAVGESVHVKFKEHPYYKGLDVLWTMGGLTCEGGVWVPYEGFLMPCAPKLA